jgi:hypothetical protein
MKTRSKISAHIIRSIPAALCFLFAVVALSSAFDSVNRSAKPVLPTRTKAFTASMESKTLTFADRVAYQCAIEKVYWRHRDWPAADGSAKSSLDEVDGETAGQLSRLVPRRLPDTVSAIGLAVAPALTLERTIRLQSQ